MVVASCLYILDVSRHDQTYGHPRDRSTMQPNACHPMDLLSEFGRFGSTRKCGWDPVELPFESTPEAIGCDSSTCSARPACPVA